MRLGIDGYNILCYNPPLRLPKYPYAPFSPHMEHTYPILMGNDHPSLDLSKLQHLHLEV